MLLLGRFVSETLHKPCVCLEAQPHKHRILLPVLTEGASPPIRLPLHHENGFSHQDAPVESLATPPKFEEVPGAELLPADPDPVTSGTFSRVDFPSTMLLCVSPLVASLVAVLSIILQRFPDADSVAVAAGSAMSSCIRGYVKH